MDDALMHVGGELKAEVIGCFVQKRVDRISHSMALYNM